MSGMGCMTCPGAKRPISVQKIQTEQFRLNANLKLGKVKIALKMRPVF